MTPRGSGEGMGTSPTTSDPPAPDRTIRGRYRVLHRLGAGASAQTFACFDSERERKVAIKELRTGGIESWKHVEMFEREARVLASLRHHGIPEIYDFFEDEHEGAGMQLYLVQELIEGPSLLERIHRAPALGEADVLDIVLGVLDILDYLHGRMPPVYHRDIKPSNIVLRPSGAPVLVDFGGVCHGWRPEQTGGSTVTGTYGYMPPEQLMGRVSPQSDLYALGATMLHVVTGRDPTEFDFDSGRLNVPEDIAVRPALRRAIDGLLAPAPRDRPRAAKQVRTLLFDAAHGPTNASPTQALVPARRTGSVPAVVGADAPHWIDTGAPPRDPKGPFADVYHNLMQPLAHTGSAVGAGKVLAWALYGFAALATLGIVPAVYRAHVLGRRRRYEDVFRHGIQVEGTIVSVHGSEEYNFHATIGYEYIVAGQTYRAFIKYGMSLKNYWMLGDRVAVLHLPDDPGRSCIVFRRGR